jgi:hypothetical protein
MTLLKKPLMLLFSLLGGVAVLVFELSRPAVEPRPPLPTTASAAGLAPAELVAQLETLQTERQSASTRVAALETEVRQLRKELAVRSEANLEQAPAQSSPARKGGGSDQRAPAEAPAPLPFAKSVLDLAVKAGQLNARIQQQPELDIPELQYLDEGDWIHFAKEADMDSEAGVRKVLADLRKRAKDQFAPLAMQALSAYAKTNGGQPPVSISQLTPYLPESTDPAILNRYNLLPANSPQQPASPSIGGPMILREKAVVDNQYDTGFDIGPTGWTSVGVGMAYIHKLK